MTVLEPFRDAINDSLKEYLKSVKQDAKDLAPEIDKIIEWVFHDFEKISSQNTSMKEEIMLEDLITDALNLLKAVLSQSKKFYETKHKISSFNSIFIVGSGLSLESKVFSTPLLYDILHFIDPLDYNQFTDPLDYSPLRSDNSKCIKFKETVRNILEGKKPGKSHEIIAKNFPSKIIEIIDLNWDGLLEEALVSTGVGNVKVNKDVMVDTPNHLWKFHGDVMQFNSVNSPGNLGWIFPDEEGYVFQNFRSYISKQGLDEKLFVLVIVGYSESEMEVKNIIETFEKNPPRPTYRVGLDLKFVNNKDYLLGPSAYVLPRILE